MLLMSVQKYGNADIEIDYLESELEGENEQLFLGEKDKQKYYITKNYIVDWNAVGYSLDSIIKISEIERVNITGIIETRRRYLSKTRIYDTFGKEMYIESAIQTSDSIKDRKRAYEKIIADNEMINKILTMLQERNVNIEIIRDHASEEVTEPSESSYMGQGMSRTSRIYAKGDFHQDDQGHYTEGGLRVDEYGRPIKA